jgi:hypothetical protein
MRIFLENAVAGGLLANRHGVELTSAQIVAPVMSQLDKIARESYPLYPIMKHSDIIFHAEGQGDEHDLPMLSALNWLMTTAYSKIHLLIRNALDLYGVADSKKIARKADLRLSGVAPGSIYVGLKLMLPESDLFPGGDELRENLLDTACRLPSFARCIGEQEISPDIVEVEQDPAIRDVALASLFAFSPTGSRRDIQTISISSQNHGMAVLSPHGKKILREALDKPKISQKESSFEGEVREADLDRKSFHLRTIDGIIRCVDPTLTTKSAKNMLGRKLRVHGNYQTNRENQPRLMFVENFDLLPETGKLI